MVTSQVREAMSWGNKVQLMGPGATWDLWPSSRQGQWQWYLSSHTWQRRCMAHAKLRVTQAGSVQGYVQKKQKHGTRFILLNTNMPLYYLIFFFPFVTYLSMFTQWGKSTSSGSDWPNQLIILYPLNTHQFLLGRDIFTLIQSHSYS